MKQSAVLSIAIGALLIAFASESEASEVKRRPVRPALLEGTRPPIVEAKARTNELNITRYDAVATVVRARTPGKKFAVFSADPQFIEHGAVVLFEARSVGGNGSLTRWRCIAKTDVAECLGSPLKIRYLSDDDRVVLTARMKPLHETAEVATFARN
jgi:hypothetical protein